MLDALAQRIRSLALSLPETYEDEPWGHPVFYVLTDEPAEGSALRKGRQRMFAAMSISEDTVQLTVKLTREEREIAELPPYVHRARYVGRYGWVTADVADEETLESALEWLRESYWLRAPAHLRSAVEETD